MKALTFHGKQDIRYETVPDPEILASHEVVIKVDLAGICGSDLHVYHEREKGLDEGTVMGHELTGVIVECGREVKKFKTGERVLSPFTTNCGTCFYCRRGLTARCTEGQLLGWVQNGRGLHGAQAEYIRVPQADSTLLTVPEAVSSEEALLLGDVLATGYFCAHMAEIEPEGTYAVIGCGPVGLMAIIGARELGAGQIYAIDAIPARLKLAAKFGALPLNFQEEEVLAILCDATAGRGADAVLEVVGNEAASSMAMNLVRPGGIIATVGVHNESHFSFSPAEAYDKNLTFKIGRCPARFYAERLLPVLARRKYDLQAVISHRLPLPEGPRGYRVFDEKLDNCTKVILQP